MKAEFQTTQNNADILRTVIRPQFFCICSDSGGRGGNGGISRTESLTHVTDNSYMKGVLAMKKLRSTLAVCAASAAMAAAVVPSLGSAAENGTLLGYRGDVNHDMQVNAADVVGLAKHLKRVDSLTSEYLLNADLNDDMSVDCFDLAILRKCASGAMELIGIYSEEETTTEAETTEPTTWEEVTEETTTEPAEDAEFIEAPIAELSASLPSQGDANLVIFYVDFPDCRYDYEPSTELISQLAYGGADESSDKYPHESMHAFYERSSKGAMNLTGQVFRYTTKENQSAYNTDKVKIAEECYDAFADSVDFSQFDGDGDGMIDATLFTVPTAAGDTDWWPCAGGFGDGNYRVDGMAIGHIITGNAQINSETDTRNFVTSYLHEMGHCMGLPDYYLYSSTDYEGLHGDAGLELMDVDASSDFCSFSKLMLGWYRQNQVEVYDSSLGSQSFTLSNAQRDGGNCVIIPYGTLDSQYFSEYFIIEYATAEANNSGIWWQSSSGVRVHHVKADIYDNGLWKHLKYQNGSEFTNGDDAGIRTLRIVNDTSTDNFFRTGSVIDNSVSGFGWYDSSENESIDPGVTISVGELTADGYTITITNK